jgi:hypothetical protein
MVTGMAGFGGVCSEQLINANAKEKMSNRLVIRDIGFDVFMRFCG